MEDDEESRIRELLSSVFGDSDDEHDDEEAYLSVSALQWERIEEVKGLWVCRDFLSEAGEQRLLEDIEAEAWFIDPETNQAMRFGELPLWALKLSSLIRSSVASSVAASKERPLPEDLLWREPLFNQMIVNSYQALEGIPAHIDLLRFQDGIAILSLISTRVMTFRPSKELREKADADVVVPVPVLLRPRDLLLLSTDARYDWTHEINPGHQVWDGAPVPVGRRISVTLRHLLRQE